MKAVVLMIVAVFSLAQALTQENPDLKSNAQIVAEIDRMSRSGKDTKGERTHLLWVLVMRSAQGDKEVHRLARPVAEYMLSEKDLEPRIKFAYGYFRLKEGFDTIDPVTRKRRIDTGRRPMSEALTMGARDADFLFDAGMALIGLPTDVNLYTQGINALVLSKRLFGAKFADLPKERQADWWTAMASGFDIYHLNELARDHYLTASAIAPDSPAGRKAVTWLRTHGL